ncbi:hypothetical protein E2C01_058075 [Portunus trituberculatus]|uniref:Uncharacterized protein n=1 Tax=Portunus trituberculatus TaxID=210409 RepID=A0A5B7H3Q7_PORTR|nr:hypothetical protein [Portunus trituberculatus]
MNDEVVVVLHGGVMESVLMVMVVVAVVVNELWRPEEESSCRLVRQTHLTTPFTITFTTTLTNPWASPPPSAGQHGWGMVLWSLGRVSPPLWREKRRKITVYRERSDWRVRGRRGRSGGASVPRGVEGSHSVLDHPVLSLMKRCRSVHYHQCSSSVMGRKKKTTPTTTTTSTTTARPR